MAIRAVDVTKASRKGSDAFGEALLQANAR